jgi:hypothetical protein
MEGVRSPNRLCMVHCKSPLKGLEADFVKFWSSILGLTSIVWLAGGSQTAHV